MSLCSYCVGQSIHNLIIARETNVSRLPARHPMFTIRLEIGFGNGILPIVEQKAT